MNMRIFLGSVVLAAGSQAMAFPLGDGQFNAQAPLAPVFPELEGETVDFTAIVALSNCSGSFVRFTSSQPDDFGMVLTNGHCFEGGFLDPGEVAVDRASTRTFRLLSSDGARNLATLRATRVIYATMTKTDAALYRLNQTYAQIKSQYGVDALTLAEAPPASGEPMRVVSGYWKRIYSCDVDATVFQLREDEWTFSDSIRYSSPGCETIGGTSGSPIVHAETKEVIGVNNTGNESGGRCTMNNPCEVDSTGQITVRRGASYGQQTYWFYGCIDENRQLDLNRAGCELEK